MGRETREIWEKRVARWRDSSLSAKEFALETGINARTLAYWAWKVKRGGSGAPASKGPAPKRNGRSGPADAQSTWLEVVATPLVGMPAGTLVSTPTVRDSSPPVSGAVLASFELVVATGRTIRIPASFDAEALARLLAVVEGR